MNRKHFFVRKAHRYLGLIIGIQLLLWTLSGLYFSWTNIENIRGNQYKNADYKPATFAKLVPFSELNSRVEVHSIELIEINKVPHYWINNSKLFNAESGELKNGISKAEAIKIVEQQLIPTLQIRSVSEINTVNKHHEIRNKQLPVYAVEFVGKENLKAYVSKENGKIISIRSKQWRIFDFLWMTHTMDYKSRDNFNSFALRLFSLLGLITVFSGFWLWAISSSLFRAKKI